MLTKIRIFNRNQEAFVSHVSSTFSCIEPSKEMLKYVTSKPLHQLGKHSFWKTTYLSTYFFIWKTLSNTRVFQSQWWAKMLS